jgi:hypothetical protein
MDTTTLKSAIWKKVIGSDDILEHNHYYEIIRDAIYSETGYRVNRDTIRNFFQDRNSPSPRLLDIYATFMLGGSQEAPRTYYEFMKQYKGKSDSHNSLKPPATITQSKGQGTNY